MARVEFHNKASMQGGATARLSPLIPKPLSPCNHARMSRLMKNNKDPDLPPRLWVRHLALHPATAEKTFTDAVMDLKEVIVLDGIDILPDKSGFRVRSHDLHGPLPEIVIEDSGDIFQDKDRLGREGCKLVAIVGLRDQMTRWLHGGKFLPPTTVGDHAAVGFKVGPRTWLAAGQDFLVAYHELHKQVVG